MKYSLRTLCLFQWTVAFIMASLIRPPQLCVDDYIPISVFDLCTRSFLMTVAVYLTALTMDSWINDPRDF